MATSIPLFKASGLLPVVKWMEANAIPVAEKLQAASVPATLAGGQDVTIPFRSMANLISSLSGDWGPNAGCLIGSLDGLRQTPVPGPILLASRTIREMLERVCRSMRPQASHLFYDLVPAPGGMEFSCFLAVHESDEAQHSLQQYLAMLVRQCGIAATGNPLPIKVLIMPHPRWGIAHLKPHLGPDVQACRSRKLRVYIRDADLDQAFPWSAEVARCPQFAARPALACSNLSDSIQLLIGGLFDAGTFDISLDHIAFAAGRSRRTLQRMLATEGVCFSELIDDVRRARTLTALATSSDRMTDIARDIGYGAPSSLTRAVQRWTDSAPRTYRNGQKVVH